MRIAIVGAGGVGGYYAGALARAGHDVSLLARGAHLDAIRANGLEVRTPEERYVVRVAASDAARDLVGAELVVLAVKSYSLSEVTPAVRLLAGVGAAVLPLLNGVTAADDLAAAGVPRTAILGGLTFISAARIAPGVVERRSPFQRITLGELDGTITPRVERIVAALAGAGVEARASSEIGVELWRKLTFLATLAAACGLARTPIGAVRTAPLGPELLRRSVEEVLAVGRAMGVPLGGDEAERALGALNALPPAMMPSLLLDLERGGPLELDVLSGGIAKMGRRAGVSTPVHDTAAAALAAAVAGASPR